MKGGFIILLIVLLSSARLKAQQNTTTRNQIHNRMSICWAKYYHPDDSALHKFCRSGCIFIKFKVNDKLQLSNISFSKDSDSVIKKALLTFIDSLPHDKELMGLLKSSGKTIIFPVIYDYQWGCNFPTSKLSDTPEQHKRFLASYLEKYTDRDHLGETLFNMLNFNDGDLYSIDCLLLSPMRVGATFD